MHETSDSATATPSNSTSPTWATSKTSDRTIRTRLTRTVPAARWNSLCARSAGATPFHQYECLQVLADRSDATVHPFVGYQDDHPVGLFPIFERSRGPVTTLFSPVPDHKIPYLGPVLLDRSGGPRAAHERRRRSFLGASLSCLGDRFAPSYVNVRTAPRFDDPRQFAWRGFEVVPRHSYVVDLTPEPDVLLDSFSSDARRNVRDPPDNVEVRESGHDAIDRIIEQVIARHEQQNETYLVTPAYVRDLYDALPEGVLRPYEIRLDGSFAGGLITLESGDTIYRWQGGVKPDADVPVNDLLDWHVMRAARDRGRETYDLVGANNRRIADYKAKFAPELVTFYSMEASTRPMALVSRLYKRVR
ncbi:lipid II:glycine glycyltransferase FemX (plasmid) [Halorientalis pallida]|uniref:lipid II:glycine glycyltransferase FemX n=1 Tax=Halorientalis pallida TaxID=2479928 RepID=UPI003C6FBE5C